MQSIDRSIDWSNVYANMNLEGSIDWLIDWGVVSGSVDRPIDWWIELHKFTWAILTDWFFDLLYIPYVVVNSKLVDRLIDFLISDGQRERQKNDRMILWSRSMAQLFDWLIDWRIVPLIDCLIDWFATKCIGWNSILYGWESVQPFRHSRNRF